MARTEFFELRDTVVAKPGAVEGLAELRAETMEEIRLYELRHGEAISQVELAGRLNVTQGAISKHQRSPTASTCTYHSAQTRWSWSQTVTRRHHRIVPGS